jgi:alginate O-acetyltransferase complex protein AlgI
MSVTSWQFFVLLAATVLALAMVPAAWRKGVLLAASLLFYLNAGIVSALIIALLVTANYFLLLGTMRGSSERVRDRIYMGSIVFNVAIFCALKLCFEPAPNVEATSWSVLGYSIGYPLGLSFIVLMLHGAITDAHSGRYMPDGKFGTFALFSVFFPYVSAGPVERLHRMEGPLGLPVRPTMDDLRAGASLIALGLMKKLATANRLKSYVDSAFDGALPHSMPTMIVAIVFNAAYVYCDFSGYTDVARGAARCLGVDIQINFARPFGASSITEFWRRWHISFSTWLRDYLYMPVAFMFRRFRVAGTSLALLITFTLCGFWHRAALTFLLFGLLHGAAMAAELRFGLGKAQTQRPSSASATAPGAIVAHLYTLIFLGATIVLFSATDLAQVGDIFRRTLAGRPVPSSAEFLGYRGPVMGALMLAGIVFWQVFERWQTRLTPRTTKYFLLLAAFVILFFGQTEGGDFVYAKF